jgi:tRNA(fMet)-specific endonuclease VapC
VDELRRLFRSLPFDDAAGEIAARVNAGLELKGERIGHNDLFIAAVALSQDLTLVTHNVREFGRVPGLRIEDWEATP